MPKSSCQGGRQPKASADGPLVPLRAATRRFKAIKSDKLKCTAELNQSEPSLSRRK
jgi:hypothetical protein